jgi:hypothetical protein
MLQKSILLLFCSFFALTITAQTAAIAHKSHSGKAATMPDVREGGFGNPPDQIVKVVKINATTIVEFKRYWGEDREGYTDTVRNHPYFCTSPLASLKKRFPDIIFEGFEQYETTQIAPKTSENPVIIPEPAPIPKPKKTKKKAKRWGALDYPLPSERMTLSVLGILSICAAAAFVQYRTEGNA